MAPVDDGLGNPGYLIRRLSLPVYDLGEALPGRPPVVDPRESQVLEGYAGQVVDRTLGVFRVQVTRAYGFEHCAERSVCESGGPAIVCRHGLFDSAEKSFLELHVTLFPACPIL